MKHRLEPLFHCGIECMKGHNRLAHEKVKLLCWGRRGMSMPGRSRSF